MEKTAKRIIQNAVKRISNTKDIQSMSDEFSGRHDIECRILCCKGDVDDLLFCLASFYFFSKNYMKIYIHEDGSFDEECVKTIKDIFPFIEIVRLKDASEKLKKLVSNEGMLKTRLELMDTFKFHINFIDFPFLSKRSRIMSMDSDCLFFSDPSELFDAIIGGGQFIHGQGRWFSHGSAERILREIGFANKLNLSELPKPGAYLIVYPAEFYIDQADLVHRFTNYLKASGKEVPCDQQGFLDITLKNNFKETALSSERYISTFWERAEEPADVRLKDYDFRENSKKISVIHWASDRTFADTLKPKLLEVLESETTNAISGF